MPNVIAPFYVLLVSLASAPQDVSAWRVEGGWDSCMAMEALVKRYAAAPLITRCLTNKQWDSEGRPGKKGKQWM